MLILILGIAEIPKLSKQLDDNYLAFIYNVVLVLAKTLLYIAYELNVFLDNLFTNLKLFCQLVTTTDLVTTDRDGSRGIVTWVVGTPVQDNR